MQGLASVFSGWAIANSTAVVILLAFLALFIMFAARARAGYTASLRKVDGFDAITGAVGRAAELGRPLHMALGTGGVGRTTTLETLAGIEVLDYLAHQSALCDTPLTVSVADPTVLPAAQESLYRGYAKAGYPDEYDSNQVRLWAPDNVAYAAGVMSVLHQEDLAGNVMVGAFGDEFLLMGEAGVRRGIPQIGGMTDPNTLAFAHVSMDHTLIGEEIFAAGAYLRQDRNHIGGLMAQDVMRMAIVLTAVIGVLLKILNVFRGGV